MNTGFPIMLGMTSNGGYIALISAIIISALLIIITFSVNFSSFFARFNILDSEYKKVSVGLAEACVDTAILEVAKGNDPPDDTCINVGSACTSPNPPNAKVCRICEVVPGTGNHQIIRTRASYNKAVTNFKVEVHPEPPTNPTNVAVDSWEEETNYTGSSSCTTP